MAEENTDQAQGQSVEDRIASKFMEHEAPAEPQEGQAEEEPQEEFAEIEYEGNRYQVPKALEKGFLQEADYTRKTQELANQRKLYEQSKATVDLAMMENEFHNSVAEEVSNIRAIDNYIRSLKTQNIGDMSTDDLLRHRHQIELAVDKRDELQKSVDEKRGEFQTRFKVSLKEAQAKTHDLLSKTIKGYTPEAFKDVREYGKKQGFDDSVIDSIESDPKAASVLYKSMLYDKLQAEKVTAVRKLDNPVVKPGSANPMPQDVKDKLNFRKQMNAAKTSQEKAKLIEQRLAARA